MENVGTQFILRNIIFNTKFPKLVEGSCRDYKLFLNPQYISSTIESKEYWKNGYQVTFTCTSFTHHEGGGWLGTCWQSYSNRNVTKPILERADCTYKGISISSKKTPERGGVGLFFRNLCFHDEPLLFIYLTGYSWKKILWYIMYNLYKYTNNP